ncbi:MAG: PSD1 domain-containing protein [Phycisphaeraceae bacterium]|nr:PSD1 domain-containing protein [Phycisphaeraceae bacterium]
MSDRSRHRAEWLWLGTLIAAAGAMLAAVRATSRPPLALIAGRGAEPDVRFGRDVRPILVKNCLVCHGFDPSTRKAGLRLDTFEEATRARAGGRAHAIVPGDPDRSLVLDRVSAPDPLDRMPPAGEPLSPEQIEILRAWIAQGAAYETHWSLRPLENPTPPIVADPDWNARPIDRFIASRLSALGLAPGPLAERRVLIRRLSFDLTGMPPTPEEVEAFVADQSPTAWEDLVDRLLASPRFGERWARHWLDLMRYAETYAHEYDYPIRNAWRYRDYVVRAFNQDIPYDQFVTEHIAGDLLDAPRRHPTEGYNESIIATGFWWLSQGTHAPVDVRQDEADRIDNQIDVMGKAFLATTVSCARCHDHKFDPVPTREYYGLAGFLQSSRRQDAYLDPGGRIALSARQLRAIREEADATLQRVSSRFRGQTQRIEPMLLGAADALFGSPREGESPVAHRDAVVDRFDDATYSRWTVEGEAFTATPTPATREPLEGEGTARGNGFANSHRRTPGGDSVATDRLVGRLIGPEFTIEHAYLHFLIGGGDHAGQTGLRLVIDGAPVRESTGHNSLSLRPERFDLGEFRGRTGHIEIIDQATGGWGNTRVDEIVLSDEPILERRPRRSINAVADERGLDPDRLLPWVRSMQLVDPTDPGDPLAPFVLAAQAAAGNDESIVANPSDSPDRARGELLEDFSNLDSFESWYESGWAFDGRSSRLSDWTCGPSRARLAELPSADSGRLSPRLTGTLRSGTFEITSPFLAVRTRGRGVVRVIIDGYTMDEYNALLFERVRLEVDSRGWTWSVHDLRLHQGHRAHYEIIDDDPGGSIQVDRLVLMDEDRAPRGLEWRDALIERTGPSPTLSRMAHTYADAAARALDGNEDPLGAAIVNALLDRGLWSMADPALESIAASRQSIEAACPEPIRATAMQDGPGENEHVFIRGSHTSLGEEAPRGFLSAYCSDPSIEAGAGSGRLELARRMLDDSNPLPARVMVNRVWHHLFGRGIVETTDDFGLQGQSPSHPELLDFLAHRFRHELGWSVKALIREIVLSRTYRVAAGPLSDRAARVDPRNLLLSVREPRRLDGESIRDAMLLISGRLDPTMEGPSVPAHLSPFMTGRGRPAQSGPLDGDGRRSLYLEVRRNFPMPMMATFDTPNPHSTIGKRSESNVPAQSLILLNDPFVVRQARLFADRAAAESAGPDERVDRMYELALARRPTEPERVAALGFVAAQSDAHRNAGADDAEAASRAWADLAHVLLNLKEFVFIE